MMLHSRFLLLFCLVLFFVSSGGSGALSGIWTWEGGVYGNKAPHEIRFSGRRFTLTHYANRYDSIHRRGTRVDWPTAERTEMTFVDGRDFPGESGLLGGPAFDRYYRVVTRGTYSISDGRIELVLSDGAVHVFPFSRTENTMTVNNRRFTRK
jgi:hypothetical protein